MPPRWDGGVERYRRIIYIQTRTVTVDDYGGQTTVWSDGTKRRAQVKMMYGQQIYLSSADQEVATKRYTVKIRYATDIAPNPATMRVMLDNSSTGRVLDMESASEDERKQNWVMVCKEREEDDE